MRMLKRLLNAVPQRCRRFLTTASKSDESTLARGFQQRWSRFQTPVFYSTVFVVGYFVGMQINFSHPLEREMPEEEEANGTSEANAEIPDDILYINVQEKHKTVQHRIQFHIDGPYRSWLLDLFDQENPRLFPLQISNRADAPELQFRLPLPDHPQELSNSPTPILTEAGELSCSISQHAVTFYISLAPQQSMPHHRVRLGRIRSGMEILTEDSDKELEILDWGTRETNPELMAESSTTLDLQARREALVEIQAKLRVQEAEIDSDLFAGVMAELEIELQRLNLVLA